MQCQTTDDSLMADSLPSSHYIQYQFLVCYRTSYKARMSLLHVFSKLFEKHQFCKEKENHTQMEGVCKLQNFITTACQMKKVLQRQRKPSSAQYKTLTGICIHKKPEEKQSSQMLFLHSQVQWQRKHCCLSAVLAGTSRCVVKTQRAHVLILGSLPWARRRKCLVAHECL